MTTQISPSLLQSNGVRVYQARQDARTFIVTFPKAYHCGFNYGFNINEAVNFATPDWLSLGAEAEERYRLLARGSVFSHHRLLFTLLYHLEKEEDEEKQRRALVKSEYSDIHTTTAMSACLYKNVEVKPCNNTTTTGGSTCDDSTDKTTTSDTAAVTITSTYAINTIETESHVNIDNTANTTDTIKVSVESTGDSLSPPTAVTMTAPSRSADTFTTAPVAVPAEYQHVLAEQIIAVVDEELYYRLAIIKAGIVDISTKVQLPRNDFTVLSKKVN
jgi:hypothetical protein